MVVINELLNLEEKSFNNVGRRAIQHLQRKGCKPEFIQGIRSVSERTGLNVAFRKLGTVHYSQIR